MSRRDRLTRSEAERIAASRIRRGAWVYDRELGTIYTKDGARVDRPEKTQRPEGYRVVCVAGASAYAHRVIYRACVGPIPASKRVDHRDEHKGHNWLSNLQLLSNGDNIRKSVAYRRAVGRLKTSPTVIAQAKAMRAAGVGSLAICEALGLSEATVSIITRSAMAGPPVVRKLSRHQVMQ